MPEWETLFGVGSAQILRRLQLSSGARVLDVGAGAGRISLPAARQVGATGKVVALDLRAAALKRLAHRAEAERLSNLEILESSIEAAPLPLSTFDWALFVGVLGETREPEAALRRVFFALKPDGCLSLTEARLDPHFQNLGKVMELAAQAGFQGEPRLYRFWTGYTLNLSKL